MNGTMFWLTRRGLSLFGWFLFKSLDLSGFAYSRLATIEVAFMNFLLVVLPSVYLLKSKFLVSHDTFVNNILIKIPTLVVSLGSRNIEPIIVWIYTILLGTIPLHFIFKQVKERKLFPQYFVILVSSALLAYFGKTDLVVSNIDQFVSSVFQPVRVLLSSVFHVPYVYSKSLFGLWFFDWTRSYIKGGDLYFAGVWTFGMVMFQFYIIPLWIYSIYCRFAGKNDFIKQFGLIRFLLNLIQNKTSESKTVADLRKRYLAFEKLKGSKLNSVRGFAFEDWCADFLRLLMPDRNINTMQTLKKFILKEGANGKKYKVGAVQNLDGDWIEVTGFDQGSDIWIAPTENKKGILVQCKHSLSDGGLDHAKTQGIFAAREYYKSIYGDFEIMIVTNSYYRDAAEDLAQKGGLTTINGSEILSLLNELDNSLRNDGKINTQSFVAPGTQEGEVQKLEIDWNSDYRKGAAHIASETVRIPAMVPGQDGLLAQKRRKSYV